MPRPRYERASAELKTAVLAAARRELARAGYEAASLNRILEEAGLSKGAFYYYFDDKEDLAATVLLDLYSPVLANLDALRNPESAEQFWGELKLLSRRLLDTLESSRESMDVVASLGRGMTRNRQLAARVMPAFAPLTSALVELLRKGQELGAIRKDLAPETVSAVVSGMKEALARALLPAEGSLSPEELERFAEISWDLFRRVARAEDR